MLPEMSIAKKNNFYETLSNEIRDNLDNNYTDNFDHYRFGKPTFETKVKSKIEYAMGLFKEKYRTKNSTSLERVLPYFPQFNALFDLLADEHSKKLLIQIITYRILGHRRYKLPLADTFWRDMAELESVLQPTGETLRAKFVDDMEISFNQYDLSNIGVPVKLFTTPGGTYHNFRMNQYSYNYGQTKIQVEKGDVVLDCGACWGDTAVMFAHEGATVYSFEFIPSNIDIFKKNIELNSHLQTKIKLIPRPLGATTGQELFYVDNGPGSWVSPTQVNSSKKIKILTIDDFFTEYKLDKVDFIKMDIEGAELPALKGAVNVLRKFKPKLAISIYHSLNDFVNIAPFIESLDLGYKFYLNHGTIHGEETVLLGQV